MFQKPHRTSRILKAKGFYTGIQAEWKSTTVVSAHFLCISVLHYRNEMDVK
jgi:hypothetical protein